MDQFNQSHLNKKVYLNILHSCNEALTNKSGQAYVNNKHGNPYLRVTKVIRLDGKVVFRVTDKRQKNIASELQKGLDKVLKLNDYNTTTRQVKAFNNLIGYDFEILNRKEV